MLHNFFVTDIFLILGSDPGSLRPVLCPHCTLQLSFPRNFLAWRKLCLYGKFTFVAVWFRTAKRQNISKMKSNKLEPVSSFVEFEVRISEDRTRIFFILKNNRYGV